MPRHADGFLSIMVMMMMMIHVVISSSNNMTVEDDVLFRQEHVETREFSSSSQNKDIKT